MCETFFRCYNFAKYLFLPHIIWIVVRVVRGFDLSPWPLIIKNIKNVNNSKNRIVFF